MGVQVRIQIFRLNMGLVVVYYNSLKGSPLVELKIYSKVLCLAAAFIILSM